ncbi:MAG: PIG-L family deacetylase [Gammaproteobacteria bacterium]|nr:PIG-L family deacetylase [Gammaproteobacteria bacterium]
MSTSSHNLVIVAHPDDESIYFSGLMRQMRTLPWKVICVTDGDADGAADRRMNQLERACESLKVDSIEHWDYPDIFEKRLDVDHLSKKLEKLQKQNQIYTHGILGEYGHPHHQDVSYVVHKVWSKKVDVYSIAYNCFPDMKIELTQRDYDLKTYVLSEIYGSEINRFANLVPGTSCEGFAKVEWDEVQAIYRALTTKESLNVEKLNKYRWLAKHIQTTLSQPKDRLF